MVAMLWPRLVRPDRIRTAGEWGTHRATTGKLTMVVQRSGRIVGRKDCSRERGHKDVAVHFSRFQLLRILALSNVST